MKIKPPVEKVPLIAAAPIPTSDSQEETLEMLLQTDELCMHSISNLSKLHEETMSIIDNQLAIDALETGQLQSGIEALQSSVQNGRNAAALFNFGLCYERGIGVQKDRAKVNEPSGNGE
jgi:TPR repeat protein